MVVISPPSTHLRGAIQMRARGGSASHTQKDAMDYFEEIRVVRMIYILTRRLYL